MSTAEPGQSELILRGVRVHNLQGVDVAIPVGKLAVVVGPSGAGKTSLLFDTLHTESQRRYFQSFSPTARQKLDRLEKPDADWIGPLPPAVAVKAESDLAQGSHGQRTVGDITRITSSLAALFVRAGRAVCPDCGLDAPPVDADFIVQAVRSAPVGTRYSLGFPARPESADDIDVWAQGLRLEGFARLMIAGEMVRLDQDDYRPRLEKAISKKNVLVWVLADRGEVGKENADRLAESVRLALDRGLGEMVVRLDETDKIWRTGRRCPRCDRAIPAPELRHFEFDPLLELCDQCQGDDAARKACPRCKGRSLAMGTLAYRVLDRTVGQWSTQPIERIRQDLAEAIASDEETLGPATRAIVGDLLRRLDAVITFRLGAFVPVQVVREIGVSGLTRLTLAGLLGESFAQTLFVIEEPSAGLHPEEMPALLAGLRALLSAGNTLVVVDHSPELWRAADWLIELGPGAGEEGGRVLYAGEPSGLLGVADSASAKVLSEPRSASLPARRKPTSVIEIPEKNISPFQGSLSFPMGVFVALAGPTISTPAGFSENLLAAALREADSSWVVHVVDQPQASGRGSSGSKAASPRGIVATHVKAFDEIRQLFADAHDSKLRGYTPGHFSFQQAGGRCDECEGQGVTRIDMQFLADVRMTCPECHGRRYRRDILDVKVRGRSIAEVLDLTVREAFRFFRAQTKIERLLKPLLDVGFDYLRLGQSLETLSTGETRRLRLASALGHAKKDRTLFIVSWPTLGLHPSEVARFADGLRIACDAGHAILAVDNNPWLIARADHVIEMAGPPESRSLAFAGTPEHLARQQTPLGNSLRGVLGVG